MTYLKVKIIRIISKLTVKLKGIYENIQGNMINEILNNSKSTIEILYLSTYMLFFA